MTATAWVLIIVALAAAGGFAIGRLGHDEAVEDADREQTRADLLAIHLRRAIKKIRDTKRLTTERPEWLPSPRSRWVPEHARRRTALQRLGIR